MGVTNLGCGSSARTCTTRPWRPFTDVNGTPYNGNTTDNEGIAVLPDGDFAISSEEHSPCGQRIRPTHPTIRIFDANGRQKGELEVPQLFRHQHAQGSGVA